MRPCGCSGKPGARHDDACPERGRKTSGPSGKGNPQYRLPEELGELAAEVVASGKVSEACKALGDVLAKQRDLPSG